MRHFVSCARALRHLCSRSHLYSRQLACLFRARGSSPYLSFAQCETGGTQSQQSWRRMRRRRIFLLQRTRMSPPNSAYRLGHTCHSTMRTQSGMKMSLQQSKGQSMRRRLTMRSRCSSIRARSSRLVASSFCSQTMLRACSSHLLTTASATTRRVKPQKARFLQVMGPRSVWPLIVASCQLKGQQ